MPLTPNTIAAALETAPAWALLALTIPSDRLREDARAEVAAHVMAALVREDAASRDQLALPL